MQKHGNFKENFLLFLVISKKGIVDKNIISWKMISPMLKILHQNLAAPDQGFFLGKCFSNQKKVIAFEFYCHQILEKDFLFLNAKSYPKLQQVTKNIDARIFLLSNFNSRFNWTSWTMNQPCIELLRFFNKLTIKCVLGWLGGREVDFHLWGSRVNSNNWRVLTWYKLKLMNLSII